MSAGPPIPDELWQQIPPAAQAAILALIQRYEQRLADLEARLNQNSTNSSKPPSSDPPALKRAPPKPTSARKVGGQNGHAKAQRDLHDRPDRVQECKPTSCRNCHQPLHGDDPQPLRHQVWDVPPVRPIVTEYRRLNRPHAARTTTAGRAAPPPPAGRAGERSATSLKTGSWRRVSWSFWFS